MNCDVEVLCLNNSLKVLDCSNKISSLKFSHQNFIVHISSVSLTLLSFCACTSYKINVKSECSRFPVNV